MTFTITFIIPSDVSQFMYISSTKHIIIIMSFTDYHNNKILLYYNFIRTKITILQTVSSDGAFNFIYNSETSE